VASIRITRYEARNNLLPPICIVCGEPTTDIKRHTFKWTPPWVGILILGVLLPYLIVAMILRKSITMELPIATRKKWHWLWRQLFALFGVLGCIALVVVGFVLSHEPGGRNQGPDIGLYTAMAAGVGLVFVLIIAVILQNTSVRPKEITDDDITLVGVHENFIVALEEERDRDEEEEQERRDTKRAEREKNRDLPPRRVGRDEDEPRRTKRIRDDDD